MFALDAVEAGKGDALIIRWGERSNPGLVLIDGGPAKTWTGHLLPRLREIAGSATGIQTIPLSLVIVSHVDADHITGIIDVVRDLKVSGERAERAAVDVEEIWHNSFDDLEFVAELPAALADLVRAASFDRGVLHGDADVETVRAVASSVPQGRTLAGFIDAIGIPRNSDFDGTLVVAESPTNRRDLGGLDIQVICPNAEMLGQLRTKWLQELTKQLDKDLARSQSERRALATAFDDPSVPNQSSIVAMISHDGRRMLLTGDVRGDHLLAGLTSAGFLAADRTAPLELDLFKVPHHGSTHSNSIELFERIHAHHYVISGNGKHGNPHPDVLEMILAARRDARISIWLTNSPLAGATKPDELKKARKAQTILDRLESDPNVTVHYRGAERHALTVELT